MPVLNHEEFAVCVGNKKVINKLLSSGKLEKMTAAGRDKLTALQEKLIDNLHVSRVNDLIPEAEVRANNECQHIQDSKEKRNTWDKVFHREMNALTRKAGLRR